MASNYEFPSDSFSASSSRFSYGPDMARLNGNSAWFSSTDSSIDDYLQINLYYEFIICAVATQGSPSYDNWTTKYKLILSLNNRNWITYKENGTEKVCNKLINYPHPPPPFQQSQTRINNKWQEEVTWSSG